METTHCLLRGRSFWKSSIFRGRVVKLEQLPQPFRQEDEGFLAADWIDPLADETTYIGIDDQYGWLSGANWRPRGRPGTNHQAMK